MKPELKLIKSPPPQEPPDFKRIYRRLIKECIIAENTSKNWKKRFVYLMIKGLPIIYDDAISRKSLSNILSEELLSYIMLSIGLAQELMGQLTPNEFMTVYPIEKKYDGHRYGFKDYSSTMEELEKIGMDTPIGEHVDSLLFNYQNHYVIDFNVFKMMVVDRIRAYQGQPSMISAFMAEKGAFPMKMMTDNNGKNFIYDPAKHTSFPILKRYPRYLKVIK